MAELVESTPLLREHMSRDVSRVQIPSPLPRILVTVDFHTVTYIILVINNTGIDMTVKYKTILDKMSPSDKERFWSKVDIKSEEECWPWKDHLNSRGYGQIAVHDQGVQDKLMAHRVAKTLSLGEEIPSNKVTMHTCDNPPCCNPEHLVVGTQQENMDDMVDKSRSVTSFGHAKLDWEDVESIRGSRLSGKALAHNYEVSKGTISDIRNNKIWKEEHQFKAVLPSR